MKKKLRTIAIALAAAVMLTAGASYFGGDVIEAASTRLREAQVLFSGSGHDHSGTTNGADTVRVLRAGDTMTGLLTINYATNAISLDVNNATAGGSGIESEATTGRAVYGLVTTGIGVYGKASGNGRGVIGEAASNGDGVYGYNLSTGNGILGFNNSTGIAIRGNMTGTGKAGYFEVANAANTVAALSGVTTGTGNSSYGVYGQASGTGRGVFGLNATAAAGAGVYGEQRGVGAGVYGLQTASGWGVYGSAEAATGRAGFFRNSNVASTVAAVTGETLGTSATSYGVHGTALGVGSGVRGASSVSGGNGVYGTSVGIGVGVYGSNNSIGWGVLGHNSSTGIGVYGQNTNLGIAGYFQSTNASSATATVYATNVGIATGTYGVHAALTAGSSKGTSFYATNVGAEGVLYAGNHTGSAGYLLNLQSAGNNIFVVDKAGNTYASGTIQVGATASATGYIASGGTGITGCYDAGNSGERITFVGGIITETSGNNCP